MKKQTDTSSKDTISTHTVQIDIDESELIRLLESAAQRINELQQQLDDANETISRLQNERGDGTE